ncbi:MAG: hypothetical protein KJZ72_02370 [Anaerolineales bacterium]|nr:hypothetical protein [Anaerolineales bacterium]
MGLFGDKLLFRLNASSISSGELKLQIEKEDSRSFHLFPFSCISLIGSQLMILSSRHPRSLSRKVLEFVENPQSKFETTSYVSGFKLDIFQGDGRLLYNQFEPFYSRSIPVYDDNPLQTDIERLLMNFLYSIVDKLGNSDMSNLQIFLLTTIIFYQQELIPIIRRINLNDIDQRKRLSKTLIDFTNTIYRSWDNPKSISPGNKLFTDNLNSAKEFESYLV